MTREEFRDYHKAFSDKARITSWVKSADYASDEDCFKNVRLCEHLGLCDTVTGILVRACDKFSRLANVIKKKAEVKDETVFDTLQDGVNYFIMCAAELSEKMKGSPQLTFDLDQMTVSDEDIQTEKCQCDTTEINELFFRLNPYDGSTSCVRCGKGNPDTIEKKDCKRKVTDLTQGLKDLRDGKPIPCHNPNIGPF